MSATIWALQLFQSPHYSKLEIVSGHVKLEKFKHHDSICFCNTKDTLTVRFLKLILSR